ncbi:MAG: hypothetical protein ACREMU_05265, partial [Gemmatimonadaceae bacterium]
MPSRRSFRILLSIAVIASLSAGAAHAQDATERARAHVMLKQVRDAIQKNYLDTTWHGINLQSQFTTLDARIDQSTSVGEMLAAVAQLALSLGDSHTFFVPPQQTLRVDYGWDEIAIGDSVYVRRVKVGSDEERQGVHAGDRLLSVNGYKPTRQNLWKLTYLYRLLRLQPGLH